MGAMFVETFLVMAQESPKKVYGSGIPSYLYKHSYGSKIPGSPKTGFDKGKNKAIHLRSPGGFFLSQTLLVGQTET